MFHRYCIAEWFVGDEKELEKARTTGKYRVKHSQCPLCRSNVEPKTIDEIVTAEIMTAK